MGNPTETRWLWATEHFPDLIRGVWSGVLVGRESLEVVKCRGGIGATVKGNPSRLLGVPE
jgi:hypothetical protein